jgi:hypothetical protein
MDPWRLLLLLVVILLVAAPSVYRRMKEERDPEWERRWRQLPLAERWRLSRRAQQGITPDDPIEAELVSGSARCQRSVRRSVSYGGVVRLIVASMILLAAIAEGSVPMIGMALAFLGLIVLLRHRGRGLDRKLAHAEDLGAGPGADRYRP